MSFSTAWPAMSMQPLDATPSWLHQWWRPCPSVLSSSPQEYSAWRLRSRAQPPRLCYCSFAPAYQAAPLRRGWLRPPPVQRQRRMALSTRYSRACSLRHWTRRGDWWSCRAPRLASRPPEASHSATTKFTLATAGARRGARGARIARGATRAAYRAGGRWPRDRLAAPCPRAVQLANRPRTALPGSLGRVRPRPARALRRARLAIVIVIVMP